MADNMLHSPGIKITETDRSFVPARPLIAGAAIIGPTPIGPAYAPTVVTSYGDYQRRFGTTFMMNRYAEDTKKKAEEAAAAAEEEAVEQLNNQYVCLQDPDAEEGFRYVPYLEALSMLEGGETIYVCVEDDGSQEG